MIRNLGRVLSIVVRAEVDEHSLHADVSAWGAPSECHDDVSRGEERRMQEAVRQAEAEAGKSWEDIVEEAKQRGFQFNGPQYWNAFNRIYQRHGFPY
jgi:hypothetical protein